MSFNPDRKVYKVVLLGNGGVGKTSLRKRYLGELTRLYTKPLPICQSQNRAL